MRFSELVVEALDPDNAKKLIFKTLNKLCSYDSWDDGPVNPGPLLRKYGKKYDYSIRDKYYDIDVIDTNTIEIVWITQETPSKSAITMISKALETISEQLQGYTIMIEVRDRDENEKYKKTVDF